MDDTKRQPQELVHGCTNGLHLGFAIVGVGVVEQAVIQIMDKRIVLGGNDGRHVERMAKDVDAALHAVAEQAGGLSHDNAAQFVSEMRASKRYLRDVY